MSADVLLDRPAPRVARITLNTPETRNAASPGRTKLLRQLFDQALDDETVGAVVFTGAGGNFASGGNVKGFGTREPIEFLGSVRQAQALLRRVLQGDKPVVAAVEGFAAGAGVGMACMCDVIVADANTRFVFPFTRIGMVPDLGLHYTLGQRIGPARARRIMLLAQTLDGPDAERLGLVDELATAGQVQERALELAQQLAAGPPAAMASLRRGFYVAAAALESVLEYEAAAMAIAVTGHESREGVAAFLEKRPPRFS
ncbi:enoyl-CoA hydratase/isomerase family protein [Phenylobacterium zucineum HLK1]|uniref:Enoyl-CoA hydratase/isomerase family protein n=1 Tax=Phenylobacterium zucineum (strain HLK1) TaxID=450851 RepID=B4RH10_PHEZH|nr:enoyl-CoA hydratase/isomerase family protein [Phenylobacterium zucineum]ACG78958.1 enoyl-CoA hydratase/isomerase family protein [Phenylobacterium zucineum HLK1]